MTFPSPPSGRPDQSVNPNADFQMGQSFGTLITTIQALQGTIQNQVSFMERQADAQARYAQAGVQTLPQIRQPVLQQITRYGGMSQGMTGQASQMTGPGALSSLQNLQAFTSQRIGQWAAGMPLFTSPGGGGGGGGGQGSPGMTPVGMPNSASVPAGTGAQAYNQAASVQVAYQALGGAGGGGGPGPGGGGGAPGGAPPAGGTPPSPAGGRNAVMQLAGSRIAMSGGSPGGLTSALQGLPGVGLITDLYNSLTGSFQANWQAGRAFQETEGGTNLGGQAERLHQMAYQASMALTPLGAGGAAEAFRGVTDLGYNRASSSFQTTSGAGQGGNYAQDRQGALNFVYNQYTQSGATIQQTLATLETASQNSSISLGNLNTILNNLSKTAGEAGDNADSMRQSFQQAFEQAVTGLGAGPGAPQLAGAVSSTQASYGAAFAGTSFAGELSQGRQYLLAGQYGITPGQAQYVARNAPGQYANMLSGQNLQFIQQLPGMTQQALQSLQGMISQQGGGGAISKNPDAVNNIANQWLNQWQVPNDINLDVWSQMLSQLTGINLTNGNVMQWVIQQVAGNNEASAAAQMPQSTGAGTASGSATVSAASAASGKSGAVTGQYGLATGTAPSTGAAASRFAGPSAMGTTWQQQLVKDSGSAAQAYLSQEKKTGQRSPVLEALLQNTTAGDQVAVQTKNGPKVMSMTDAMKYYPDELASGNVTFFSANGKTMLGNTAQITHGLTAPDSSGVAAEERGAAGSNLGTTLKKWQKAHPTATSAQTGKTVMIDLSTEAKQLLKVLPTNYDQASASGTVPAVPWPSTSSR